MVLRSIKNIHQMLTEIVSCVREGHQYSLANRGHRALCFAGKWQWPKRHCRNECKWLFWCIAGNVFSCFCFICSRSQGFSGLIYNCVWSKLTWSDWTRAVHLKRPYEQELFQVGLQVFADNNYLIAFCYRSGCLIICLRASALCIRSTIIPPWLTDPQQFHYCTDSNPGTGADDAFVLKRGVWRNATWPSHSRLAIATSARHFQICFLP